LRATGPLALASLVEYAIPCAEGLKDLHCQCRDGVLPQDNVKRPDFPSVPSEGITLLSEFIEYAEPGQADLIEELLRAIQVQVARLRSLLGGIGKSTVLIRKENIDEYLINTACIYAMAGAAFDYFRRKSDELPKSVSWENVKSALRNVEVSENRYPETYGLIDRLALQNPNGPPRWGSDI
jgi:hypothetical protein